MQVVVYINDEKKEFFAAKKLTVEEVDNNITEQGRLRINEVGNNTVKTLAVFNKDCWMYYRITD